MRVDTVVISNLIVFMFSFTKNSIYMMLFFMLNIPYGFVYLNVNRLSRSSLKYGA